MSGRNPMDDAPYYGRLDKNSEEYRNWEKELCEYYGCTISEIREGIEMAEQELKNEL